MDDTLTAQFERNRDRLRAVAYRMLGTPDDAEDAVQEAWLRLHRARAGDIDNLTGWLTTVVARVCLDMLRARRSLREEILDEQTADEIGDHRAADPESQLLLADAIGPAMLVVLDTLTPAERLAFVLHDTFAVPFADVATIVGCSPAAARQLASRARRRVRGASADGAIDAARQREIVSAFLAASRAGDFTGLVTLLAPDVLLRADAVTVQAGAQPEVRGADAVAKTFSGRANAARLAFIDDVPGLVWAQGGQPRVVFKFTTVEGKVTRIEMVGDPDSIARLDIQWPPR